MSGWHKGRSIRTTSLGVALAVAVPLSLAGPLGLTGPAGAAAAPETTITSGPPDGVVLRGRAVVYGLESSATPPSFTCSLNDRPITCTTSGADLSNLEGGTYTLRAAATDATGLADPTPAERTFTVPFDDDVLTQKGEWSDHKKPAAFDGDYVRSTDKGAKLVYRVSDVVGIRLAVSTGPEFGRVQVMLGSKVLKTVNTRGGVRSLRLKPVATFDTPRAGKLRIVVAGHREVRIEGLAVITG